MPTPITSALTTRLGPLPAWAWGVGAGVAIVGVRALLSARADADAEAAAEAEADADPGPPGYVDLGADGAFELAPGPTGGAIYRPAPDYEQPQPDEPEQTIDTNAAWRLAVNRYMIANEDFEPTLVDSALGKYLNGDEVTEREADIVNIAIRKLGPAPQSAPPIRVTVPRTVTPPTPTPQTPTPTNPAQSRPPNVPGTPNPLPGESFQRTLCTTIKPGNTPFAMLKFMKGGTNPTTAELYRFGRINGLGASWPNGVFTLTPWRVGFRVCFN